MPLKSAHLRSRVAEVLAVADRPLRAREIHAAVELLLGESVNWSSVKGTLAANARGVGARFARVSRGRYRLA